MLEIPRNKPYQIKNFYNYIKTVTSLYKTYTIRCISNLYLLDIFLKDKKIEHKVPVYIITYNNFKKIYKELDILTETNKDKKIQISKNLNLHRIEIYERIDNLTKTIFYEIKLEISLRQYKKNKKLITNHILIEEIPNIQNYTPYNSNLYKKIESIQKWITIRSNNIWYGLHQALYNIKVSERHAKTNINVKERLKLSTILKHTLMRYIKLVNYETLLYITMFYYNFEFINPEMTYINKKKDYYTLKKIIYKTFKDKKLLKNNRFIMNNYKKIKEKQYND